MTVNRQVVFGAVVALFVSMASGTGATESLEDVLSGFDDGGSKQVEQVATDSFEDVLSGFDDGAGAKERQSREGEEAEGRGVPPWLQPFGSLALKTTWNLAHDAPAQGEADFRGLSMARTTLRLGADLKFDDWQARITGHGFYDAGYTVNGRDQYGAALLDDSEQELEIDELYLQGSLSPRFDYKVGHQIVVWGKSDNLRVTDILNPIDNRMPGLVDVKDLRLPVTMTRLDYYLGDWNLSGIMIHEVRFNLNPVYPSDFLPGDTPQPPEQEIDDFSLDHQQFGLAVNGIFSGWDLSFYGAEIYDPRGHVEGVDGASKQLAHNRVAMTGLSINSALGSWLLKGEAAWWDGLEYGGVTDRDFSRVDLMAGVEYTGFAETVLSLEIVNRHIFEYDPALLNAPDTVRRDSLQTVAKLVRDFANDTIQLKILLSLLGSNGRDGAFERFQLDYDLTDDVTLTGGVIFYQSGDLGLFSDADDNDRLFFEVTFGF